MNRETNAQEAYARRAADIAAMMDWIGQELQGHAQRAAECPQNWGMVGDLDYVRQRLREALAFIGPASEAEINEALEDMRA